jgi:hypothetical protein
MIEDIKKALEAATPGIWWHYQTNNSVVSDHKDLIWGRKTIATCNSFDDARLLANAPEWLSYLLGELDAAKQDNERLKQSGVVAIDEIVALRYERDRFQQQLNHAIEALEWYASYWNHEVQLEDIGITSMQRDSGERARKALSLIRKEHIHG